MSNSAAALEPVLASTVHIPDGTSGGIMAKGDKASERTGAYARKESVQGHEIIYPRDERRKKIFIDGRPVKWGKAGETYYLDVYAYDRGETLEETVKRYIAYLEKKGGRGKKEVK
jgi:hypothetical protein